MEASSAPLERHASGGTRSHGLVSEDMPTGEPSVDGRDSATIPVQHWVPHGEEQPPAFRTILTPSFTTRLRSSGGGAEDSGCGKSELSSPNLRTPLENSSTAQFCVEWNPENGTNPSGTSNGILLGNENDGSGHAVLSDEGEQDYSRSRDLSYDCATLPPTVRNQSMSNDPEITERVATASPLQSDLLLPSSSPPLSLPAEVGASRHMRVMANREVTLNSADSHSDSREHGMGNVLSRSEAASERNWVRGSGTFTGKIDQPYRRKVRVVASNDFDRMLSGSETDASWSRSTVLIVDGVRLEESVVRGGVQAYSFSSSSTIITPVVGAEECVQVYSHPGSRRSPANASSAAWTNSRSDGSLTPGDPDGGDQDRLSPSLAVGLCSTTAIFNSVTCNDAGLKPGPEAATGSAPKGRADRPSRRRHSRSSRIQRREMVAAHQSSGCTVPRQGADEWTRSLNVPIERATEWNRYLEDASLIDWTPVSAVYYGCQVHVDAVGESAQTPPPAHMVMPRPAQAVAEVHVASIGDARSSVRQDDGDAVELCSNDSQNAPAKEGTSSAPVSMRGVGGGWSAGEGSLVCFSSYGGGLAADLDRLVVVKGKSQQTELLLKVLSFFAQQQNSPAVIRPEERSRALAILKRVAYRMIKTQRRLAKYDLCAFSSTKAFFYPSAQRPRRENGADAANTDEYGSACADEGSMGADSFSKSAVYFGCRSIHVDSSYRLISVLESRPDCVSVSDVIALSQKPLSEPELASLMWKVIVALQSLHAAGVFHGALHGGNVLCSAADGQTVLTQAGGVMANPYYPSDPSYISPRLAAFMRPFLRHLHTPDRPMDSPHSRVLQSLPVEHEWAQHHPRRSSLSQASAGHCNRAGTRLFDAAGTAQCCPTPQNPLLDDMERRVANFLMEVLSSNDLPAPNLQDDFYALAMLLISLLSGVPPHFGCSLSDVVRKLSSGQPSPELGVALSDKASTRAGLTADDGSTTPSGGVRAATETLTPTSNSSPPRRALDDSYTADTVMPCAQAVVDDAKQAFDALLRCKYTKVRFLDAGYSEEFVNAARSLIFMCLDSSVYAADAAESPAASVIPAENHRACAGATEATAEDACHCSDAPEESPPRWRRNTKVFVGFTPESFGGGDQGADHTTTAPKNLQPVRVDALLKLKFFDSVRALDSASLQDHIHRVAYPVAKAIEEAQAAAGTSPFYLRLKRNSIMAARKEALLAVLEAYHFPPLGCISPAIMRANEQPEFDGARAGPSAVSEAPSLTAATLPTLHTVRELRDILSSANMLWPSISGVGGLISWRKPVPLLQCPHIFQQQRVSATDLLQCTSGPASQGDQHSCSNSAGCSGDRFCARHGEVMRRRAEIIRSIQVRLSFLFPPSPGAESGLLAAEGSGAFDPNTGQGAATGDADHVPTGFHGISGHQGKWLGATRDGSSSAIRSSVAASLHNAIGFTALQTPEQLAAECGLPTGFSVHKDVHAVLFSNQESRNVSLSREAVRRARRHADILILRDLTGCHIEALAPFRFVVMIRVSECEIFLGPCSACFCMAVRDTSPLAVATSRLMLDSVCQVTFNVFCVHEPYVANPGTISGVSFKPYSVSYPGLTLDWSTLSLPQEHDVTIYHPDVDGSPTVHHSAEVSRSGTSVPMTPPNCITYQDLHSPARMGDTIGKSISPRNHTSFACNLVSIPRAGKDTGERAGFTSGSASLRKSGVEALHRSCAWGSDNVVVGSAVRADAAVLNTTASIDVVRFEPSREGSSDALWGLHVSLDPMERHERATTTTGGNHGAASMSGGEKEALLSQHGCGDAEGPQAVSRNLLLFHTDLPSHDYPYMHAVIPGGNRFVHQADADSDVYFFYGELSQREIVIHNVRGGPNTRPESGDTHEVEDGDGELSREVSFQSGTPRVVLGEMMGYDVALFSDAVSRVTPVAPVDAAGQPSASVGNGSEDTTRGEGANIVAVPVDIGEDEVLKRHSSSWMVKRGPVSNKRGFYSKGDSRPRTTSTMLEDDDATNLSSGSSSQGNSPQGRRAHGCPSAAARSTRWRELEATPWLSDGSSGFLGHPHLSLSSFAFTYADEPELIEQNVDGILDAAPKQPAEPFAAHRFPILFFLDAVGDCSIDDCSQCTIFVVGSTDTVSVRRCDRVRIFVMARRLIVEECSTVEIYGFVTESANFYACVRVDTYPLWLSAPDTDAIVEEVLNATTDEEVCASLLVALEDRRIEDINLFLGQRHDAEVSFDEACEQVVNHPDTAIIISVNVPHRIAPRQSGTTGGIPTCQFFHEAALRYLGTSSDFTARFGAGNNRGDVPATSPVTRWISFPDLVYGTHVVPGVGPSGLPPLIRFHNAVGLRILRPTGSLFVHRSLPRGVELDALFPPGVERLVPEQVGAETEEVASNRGDVACDMVLERLQLGCFHIADAVGTLRIRHCKGPINIIVCAAQSVIIEASENVTLQASCFTFVAKDCRSCHMALHVNTQPRFQNCLDVVTSALNITCAGLEDLFDRAGVQQDVNLFNKPHVERDELVECGTGSAVQETTLGAATAGSHAELIARNNPHRFCLNDYYEPYPMAAAPSCPVTASMGAAWAARDVFSSMALAKDVSHCVDTLSKAFCILRRPISIVPPLLPVCVGEDDENDVPFLDFLEERVAREEARQPLELNMADALRLIGEWNFDAPAPFTCNCVECGHRRRALRVMRKSYTMRSHGLYDQSPAGASYCSEHGLHHVSQPHHDAPLSRSVSVEAMHGATNIRSMGSSPRQRTVSYQSSVDLGTPTIKAATMARDEVLHDTSFSSPRVHLSPAPWTHESDSPHRAGQHSHGAGGHQTVLFGTDRFSPCRSADSYGSERGPLSFDEAVQLEDLDGPRVIVEHGLAPLVPQLRKRAIVHVNPDEIDEASPRTYGVVPPPPRVMPLQDLRRRPTGAAAPLAAADFLATDPFDQHDDETAFSAVKPPTPTFTFVCIETTEHSKNSPLELSIEESDWGSGENLHSSQRRRSLSPKSLSSSDSWLEFTVVDEGEHPSPPSDSVSTAALGLGPHGSNTVPVQTRSGIAFFPAVAPITIEPVAGEPCRYNFGDDENGDEDSDRGDSSSLEQSGEASRLPPVVPGEPKPGGAAKEDEEERKLRLLLTEPGQGLTFAPGTTPIAAARYADSPRPGSTNSLECSRLASSSGSPAVGSSQTQLGAEDDEIVLGSSGGSVAQFCSLRDGTSNTRHAVPYVTLEARFSLSGSGSVGDGRTRKVTVVRSSGDAVLCGSGELVNASFPRSDGDVNVAWSAEMVRAGSFEDMKAVDTVVHREESQDSEVLTINSPVVAELRTPLGRKGDGATPTLPSQSRSPLPGKGHETDGPFCASPPPPFFRFRAGEPSKSNEGRLWQDPDSQLHASEAEGRHNTSPGFAYECLAPVERDPGAEDLNTEEGPEMSRSSPVFGLFHGKSKRPNLCLGPSEVGCPLVCDSRPTIASVLVAGTDVAAGSELMESLLPAKAESPPNYSTSPPLRSTAKKKRASSALGFSLGRQPRKNAGTAGDDEEGGLTALPSLKRRFSVNGGECWKDRQLDSHRLADESKVAKARQLEEQLREARELYRAQREKMTIKLSQSDSKK